VRNKDIGPKIFLGNVSAEMLNKKAACA
jgi:hypothetical protein